MTVTVTIPATPGPTWACGMSLESVHGPSPQSSQLHFTRHQLHSELVKKERLQLSRNVPHLKQHHTSSATTVARLLSPARGPKFLQVHFKMASESPRKRASSSSPSDDTSLPAKRQRTASSSTPRSAESTVSDDFIATRVDGPPNFNEQHRMELRRAITLALGHVGFDSATEEALESFTHMTETCQSLLLVM